MAYRRSKALRDFLRGLGRPRTLLKLESKLPDPPTNRLRVKSESLRGGAIVLMSATFEAFLKEALAEYVERIAKKVTYSNDHRLPSGFAYNNDMGYLDNIRYLKKADRHLEFKSHSFIVSSNLITSKSFDQTNSNANSECVDRMLKNIGMEGVWILIASEFNSISQIQLPHTIIKDKLDSYLNRRNEVAHNGVASNVTRLDLSSSIEFYEVLGNSIDIVLFNFVSSIPSR